MFYSSSFISIVMAFMMFVGYQDSVFEVVDGPMPLFENVIETSAPLQFDKVSIEFFDRYNCEDCHLISTQTIPKLRELMTSHPDIELRLFFIPDVNEPIQMEAAMALKCASDQNGFWDMHLKIHENKSNLNSKSFTQFAKELNLNAELLNQCQKDQVYKTAIEADINYINDQAFEYESMMTVNQYQLIGHLPFENIKKIIFKALDQIKAEPVHSAIINSNAN